MDHNHHWYTPQTTPTHPQNARQQYQYPQDQQPSRIAADSVQDAQTLLAGYPMASATPTTHVARHLGNMAVTAPPTSFTQPNYYSAQHGSHTQGNPPPYTEYVQELSYLASPTAPSGDNAYWENARNEAVRLLGDASSHQYSYAHHPAAQHWSQSSPSHAAYHPSAFGQSIVQRMYPSSAYPTPNPPVSSSSSLAFALGPPPSTSTQSHAPRQHVYPQPHQSQAVAPPQSQTYAALPPTSSSSTPQASYQTPQCPQHHQAQPSSQMNHPPADHSKDRPSQSTQESVQLPPIRNYPPSRAQQSPAVHAQTGNQLPPIRSAGSTDQLPPLRFLPPQTPSHNPPSHRSTPQRQSSAQQHAYPASQPRPTSAAQPTHQTYPVSADAVQPTYQHHPPQQVPHATCQHPQQSAVSQHPPAQLTAPAQHYVSPTAQHPPPQSHSIPPTHPPAPPSTQPMHHQTNYQFSFHYPHASQSQAYFHHAQQLQVPHPHSYQQSPNGHQYHHPHQYYYSQTQHPPRTVYRPEESAAFFNEFLENRTREMAMHDPRYRQDAIRHGGIQTPLSKRHPEQALRPSSTSATMNGYGGEVTPRAGTPVSIPKAATAKLPTPGATTSVPGVLPGSGTRVSDGQQTLDAPKILDMTSGASGVGSPMHSQQGEVSRVNLSQQATTTTAIATPTPPSPSALSRKRKANVQMQSASKRRLLEEQTSAFTLSQASSLTSLSSSPMRSVATEAQAEMTSLNGSTLTPPSSQGSLTTSDAGSAIGSGSRSGLGSLSVKSVSSGRSSMSEGRFVNKAYVAVPYKPWLTNPSHSSSRKDFAHRRQHKSFGSHRAGQSKVERSKRARDAVDDDEAMEDDPGDADYDDSWGYDESPTKKKSRGRLALVTPSRAEPVSGGIPLGTDHGPLSKFTSLLEDIFEAEDTLPGELSAADLEDSEFFSGLTPDGAPLLNPNVIKKLTKLIEQITRPTKRMRQAAAAGNRIVSGGGVGDSAGKPRSTMATPKVLSIGRMSDVDTAMIGRLLKLLDRTVRLGEDVDPFTTPNAKFSGNVESAMGDENGPVSGGNALVAPKSPRKRRAAKARKGDAGTKAKTTKADGEENEDGKNEINGDDERAPQLGSADVKDSDLEGLTKTLDTARDSLLAADCVIALLGSDRLTKQLYSEELITICLTAIKDQLTKLIYPFIENSTPDALAYSPFNNSALLRYLILTKVSSQSGSGHGVNLGSAAENHRKQLAEIFQILSGVIFKITKLVDAESVAMSDSIIIQSVFIAIGPFFVVEPMEGGDSAGGGIGEGKIGATEKERKRKDGNAGNVVVKTFGKSAMRGLRLEALSLIRIVFANHESQRSWIIEEILTSLIKLSDTKQKAGQFKLRDGRSIKTVSALLLQLVQTSAHDIRIEARKIHKARQDKFALKRQESFVESQKRKTSEPFLDDSDHEEIRLYSTGLESATKAAKTIILFLTQRSGKGKLTKNSNEAEYRTIFDNLVSDLLVVHNWPEWPAANLLLSIASKFMVSSLDDVKSTNQADNNAARTMGLDHLGVIAAHMRTSTLKVQQQGVEGGYRGLKTLDELVAAGDIKGLEKLLSGYRDLAIHLCRRGAEDQAYDSARELTAVTFGQELASALRSINMKIDGEDDDTASDVKDPSKLLALGKKLKASLCDIWKDPGVDVFDSLQDDLGSIDRLAEEIGTIQSMRSSFQPILGVILTALDAPPIFMRTKALRALGQIVTSDATILSTPSVRRAIESHLLDSSPAVRDAAVELIGKYMIDAPEVAGNYYQKIADRIADTGLAVRKRVIKLLKSYYTVTDSTSHRIDISTRMVLRMLDEDDTVKELAIKTLEELWFPSMSLGSGPANVRQRSGVLQSGVQSEDKLGLQGKVAVIMGAAANFKDRQSPLEEMLRKIISGKSEADVAALHARYEEICETLIDGLVDASDLPGFTVINCIRTIYLFTAAYPSILSGSRASTLLPYLKNATTPEEQTTSDYLLKIFKASIPHMPKTAAKFGQELQSALQPMIIKPSGGNLHVLQETVACLCAVVQGLTHDFSRLINLVKSCNVRLQEAIVKKPTLGPNEIRPLSILIFILSLLGQHCNFDKLRVDNDTPGLTAEINLISQGPIIEHLYDSLLKLYNKFDIPSLRGRILQCLGFLFRAQPTLMTEERSATIMDSIFTSPEEEGHGRVLKIIQEFLISESEKHANKEKDNAKVKGKPVEAQVNMEELVGNTEGFADSGVSSAVVQRYINPIIASALSQNVQIQAAAIDILTFTIKQGLTHPLQSFPVIVALETSPSSTLSNRASALHTILHTKHSSLLNARFTASARASFDYQKKITFGPVQGFRVQASIPIAMLQRWYSLVREKRPARQDFLKAMVKVFEENPGYQSSQDDVDFTRYMAENFSAFEYKTQEEVLTVIKHLTRILSTTGMQLLEVVSPSNLLAQLHSTNPNAAAQPSVTGDEMVIDNTNDPTQAGDLDKIPLMRTSVIIAMVMLLKAHLKALYSLSEEKCNKFVIGKKSAIGDRPATKRHENSISWDRLPYATAPILTSEDVRLQKARFLEIWNEDGVSAEPEDDLA